MIRLAILWQAYQRRLQRLADDIDASWFEKLAREDGLVPHAPAMTQQERSALLCQRLRLGPVAPAAFTPPAHRLVVLEKPMLLVVLATRALYARRAALSRCVDGALLARLRALVGARALAGLCAAGADPQPDCGEQSESLPAHATLLDWAMDGYAKFECDAAWCDATLRRLVQVTLPVGAATADDPAGGQTDDGVALVALLPALFPELTWLFG